ERRRPADWLEAVDPGTAGDLLAEDQLLVGTTVGLEGLGVGQPAGPDRLPLAGARENPEGALGGEICLGAGEVEVEGGRRQVDRGAGRADHYPWISQPSASRAASMTASESVGCPWTIRATSAKPPSSARTLTSSWISSVAFAPTMCPPSSSP